MDEACKWMDAVDGLMDRGKDAGMLRWTRSTQE